MNHTYRSVYNAALGTWVAVSEADGARRKGKRLRSSAAVLATALTLSAHAGPIGGTIAAGTGSVEQTGSTTTINQGSQNLSLNWQSFNTQAQETVNFVQPSASAIAVNRIADTNGTQFLGRLNANGQVYLINPNGILFGQGAQVNVGGLVASTLDINDASLNSASRSFAGSGTGSVVNQGTIKGHYVALLGNTVSNQGSITATSAAGQPGAVALGAGSAATLTFAGNSLVQMQVDESTLNNLADNGGLIKADGGKVLMSAGAKDALLASVVNNTGVIEARTVDDQDGTIILLGGMAAGTTQVGGTLDASAPDGGNGGFIETSAAHVRVLEGAQITTLAASGNGGKSGKSGTWLIDPVDFTIAASGGDMTGTQVKTALEGGNFTIQSTQGATGTAGDININATVSWTANKLTLNAQNNININATLDVRGGASLALEYGQGAVAAGNTSKVITTGGAVSLLAGTTNFTTKQGSDGAVKNYTVITSLGAAGSTTATDLQGMNGALNGNYVLGDDIDASTTSGWNAGAGFSPVGTLSTGFTGTFDGLGHTISGLTISRSSTDYVGLFGATNTGAVIQNIGLLGGSVSGKDYTGGLVGSNNGTISESHATGIVSGKTNVGGLVGYNGSRISDSYATGSVTATGVPLGFGSNLSAFGGLVGSNDSGTISNSYATGNVTFATSLAVVSLGGLVGSNDSGTISDSYATGIVSGKRNVGGLVGSNSTNGTISDSYATGKVNGNEYTGGLVGSNSTNGTISDSYATGIVSGNLFTGGLVGFNSGTISDSYATGIVSGTSPVGGLVGSNSSGTISNSYAKGNVSGATSVGGLVGSNSSGTISNSYATSIVSGNSSVGGLVGINNTNGTISDSYATGSVNGNDYTGGLVGYNSGTIDNSYAASSISGTTSVGGLVGINNSSGTISNSYWDTQTSGTTLSDGGTGLTTEQMRQQSSFVGWDFANTWVNYDGFTSPLLRNFLTPLTVTANDTTKVYDGATTVATGVSYSSTPNADLLGSFNWGGETDVGSYAPSGLYSNQQGYLISYVGGNLTVTPTSTTPPTTPTIPVTPVTPVTPSTPVTPTQPTDPAASVAAPVQPTPASPTPTPQAVNGVRTLLANLLPPVPGPSTTLTVQQINSAGNGISPDSALVVASGDSPAGDPTLGTAGPGPTLRVVDGGVKLPSTVIYIQK
ncbi:GLUG motif-containing protein [Hydrogenophaga sp. PAMC20947]|uniref:GLUG motif-containing protein n=1 Tax=Hydrogenophaga sp. PAMC20947 TaxID=2565558 RepID=UPI00109DA265|nr:GLUG motif-containing protein [Hydrogenophaga sp. PAMC20947]QCB44907.1 filamentous hemagglutinin N-terminal domain-containing protein [Hydrogenophaga sp. PAMC20947]